MRIRRYCLMILGAGLLAGCTHAASEVPTARDGWLHYAQGRARGTYPCRSEPVSVDGDRSEIRLTGDCERVRIAGSHNDIVVEVAPGGTIEVTGSHNDVTWRQSAPGPKPELKDTGVSNSFHREET